VPVAVPMVTVEPLQITVVLVASPVHVQPALLLMVRATLLVSVPLVCVAVSTGGAGQE